MVVHFLMNFVLSPFIPLFSLLAQTLSDHLHKMCLLILLCLLLVGALSNCLHRMCFFILLCVLLVGALSNCLHRMRVVFMEINIYFLEQIFTLKEPTCWNVQIERM